MFLLIELFGNDCPRPQVHTTNAQNYKATPATQRNTHGHTFSLVSGLFFDLSLSIRVRVCGCVVMRRNAVKSVLGVVLRCNLFQAFCGVIVQTPLPAMAVLSLQSALLSARWWYRRSNRRVCVTATVTFHLRVPSSGFSSVLPLPSFSQAGPWPAFLWKYLKDLGRSVNSEVPAAERSVSVGVQISRTGSSRACFHLLWIIFWRCCVARVSAGGAHRECICCSPLTGTSFDYDVVATSTTSAFVRTQT